MKAVLSAIHSEELLRSGSGSLCAPEFNGFLYIFRRV